MMIIYSNDPVLVNTCTLVSELLNIYRRLAMVEWYIVAGGGDIISLKYLFTVQLHKHIKQ